MPHLPHILSRYPASRRCAPPARGSADPVASHVPAVDVDRGTGDEAVLGQLDGDCRNLLWFADAVDQMQAGQAVGILDADKYRLSGNLFRRRIAFSI